MRTLSILMLTACLANAGLRTDVPATSTEELRSMGPAGLQVLLEDPRPDDPSWRAQVDAVAGQKDAASSGLYWYTDREQAVRVAAELGRPVLSLRMLGELTDTWSCANSRFFRTVLYAHPDVASYLREHFVLHWSSERSVPRITIDMGDGRQLRSTITGNSAHYVLDATGKPLDVLPGLYTPEHFIEELEAAEGLFHEVSVRPDARAALMRAHHQQQQEAALARLDIPGRDARQAVLTGLFTALYDAPRSRPLTVVPAGRALPMAFGKMAVEMPIADSFLISRAPTNALHPADLRIRETHRLHPATVQRIRQDQPAAADRFAATLLRDSIWNRDVLHTRIRSELASHPERDFDTLNRWVYTNVFGTPATDPWLGLYDPTIYVALPDGGITL